MENIKTFGRKLKDVRKINGFSQEELAQRLCVSRAAVAKWESERGMPDIENLKAISGLLGVSIDYLVSDESAPVGNILKQAITLSEYPLPKGNGLREDAPVLEYYSMADSIWELSRERRMTLKEKITDYVVLPGLNYTIDHWRDTSKYYLVNQNNMQFLVNVTSDYVISQRLVFPIAEHSFEISEQIYTKTKRKLK